MAEPQREMPMKSSGLYYYCLSPPHQCHGRELRHGKANQDSHLEVVPLAENSSDDFLLRFGKQSKDLSSVEKRFHLKRGKDVRELMAYDRGGDAGDYRERDETAKHAKLGDDARAHRCRC